MFRFTIRDVLLSIAIVGLALGWWIDRTRLSQESEQRKMLLEQSFVKIYVLNHGKFPPDSWYVENEINR